MYLEVKEERRLADLATEGISFKDQLPLGSVTLTVAPSLGPELLSCTTPLLMTNGTSVTFSLVAGAHGDKAQYLYLRFQGAQSGILAPIQRLDGALTATAVVNADAQVLGERWRGEVALVSAEGQVGVPVPFGAEYVPPEVTSPLEITRHLGNTWEAESVVYSASGRWMANAGRDIVSLESPTMPTIRMWDAESGVRLWIREASAPVTSMEFSPLDDVLAVGLRSGTLQLVSIGEADVVSEVTPTTEDRQADLSNAAQAIRFASGSLLVGSWDHTVRSYRLEDLSTQWEEPFDERVNALSVSPDGALVAVGTGRLTHAGHLSIHTLGDWGDNRGFSPIEFPREVSEVAFSNDGQWIAAAGGGGYLGLWEVDTAAPVVVGEYHDWPRAFSGLEDTISGLAFAPSGNQNLVATTRNGQLAVVSLLGDGVLGSMKVDRFITGAAYNTRLERLAFATSDGALIEILIGSFAAGPQSLPGATPQAAED